MPLGGDRGRASLPGHRPVAGPSLRHPGGNPTSGLYPHRRKGHPPLQSPPPAPAPGPGGMTLGRVRVLAESGAGFPARLTAFTEREGNPSSQKRSAAGHPVTGCPAALLGPLPRAILPLPHRGRPPPMPSAPRGPSTPHPPLSKKGRRQRAAAFLGRGDSRSAYPLIPPAPGKRPPQTPVPGGRGGGFWPRRRRFGW